MKSGQRVLVIGSGGREHALVWKLAQSDQVEHLFCLPGNAGTAEIATNLPGKVDDHPGILETVRKNGIDLVVIGPDDCLAAGLVDDLTAAGIPTFGPTRHAARFESSKVFAKEFMRRHGIPTGAAGVFADPDSALAYLQNSPFPVVVKAEGLALGKGVIIATTQQEARAAVESMMIQKIFGQAGERIVIEEFLVGRECSIHCFISGDQYLLCPPAQDHKRIGDGDSGPNTGGMGTCCPTPAVDDEALEQIRRLIIEPFLEGCREEGIVFRGMLFPGLMMTSDGPRVLEFNCRFGDPETQVLVRKLDSDLLDLITATIHGTLDRTRPAWNPDAALCIVAASGGYPGSYQKGLPIAGVEEAAALDGITVFHAGTARRDGQLETSGGRVLGVTALAPDLSAARHNAYHAIRQIRFDGMQFRTDLPIGLT